MTPRKWMTNSDGLINTLEHEEQSASKELAVLHETSVKVLGITWNPYTDTFTFSLRGLLEIMKEKDDTKRFVLQAASRIFDPMGFVATFTIAIKIFFQELWTRGIGWDEQLTQDLQEEWHEWVRQLPVLQNISIPRYLGSGTKSPRVLQAHVFCDASPSAYGAALYIVPTRGTE